MPKTGNNRGFTIIEILIALALGLIVFASLFMVFNAENRSYALQADIAEMQQNARAALEIMSREIRMAGYDPTGTALAGIVEAEKDRIHFTLDITSTYGPDEPDGDTQDPNEDVVYSLYTSSGIQKLGRRTGNGVNQPVAEHIDDLTFEYLTDSGGAATSVSEIGKIRIRLTARTADSDPGYNDPVHGDHYRRYTIETLITPRNL